MKIEVLTQCHMFRRRSSWHLKSIRDQVLKEGNEVLANVAVCDKEHYNLMTWQAAKVLQVPKKVFGLRGYCRNRQVWGLDSDTEYVVFADVDMVYSPYFFQELIEKIELENIVSQRTVVGLPRMSWPEDTVEGALMAWEASGGVYPVLDKRMLPDDLINSNDIYSTSNVCAGYFQLVHVDHLDGNYVHGKTRDRCTFKHGKPVMKSDMQFRKQIGHVTKWKLENEMYHLNHARGGDKEL